MYLEVSESLFELNLNESSTQSEDQGNVDEVKLRYPTEKLLNGDTQLVFAHPEALLCKEGRTLMKSQVFQKNVVACVVDEAHCVEMW